MKIIIDADACPGKIKEIIFKAAIKRAVECVIVANRYLNHPKSKYISFAVVDGGFDVADNYIIKIANENDIVISSDIPLAKEVIDKGCYVISHQGKAYNKSNIGQALSMRNFYTDMRNAGMMTSETTKFNQNNIQNFAALLDKYLTRYIGHV